MKFSSLSVLALATRTVATAASSKHHVEDLSSSSRLRFRAGGGLQANSEGNPPQKPNGDQEFSFAAAGALVNSGSANKDEEYPQGQQNNDTRFSQEDQEYIVFVV